MQSTNKCHAQVCTNNFIEVVKTKQYKPINNVIINILSKESIQYDTVVYIPTFCLTKKGYKSIVPTVYSNPDSTRPNRKQLLCAVNSTKAFHTLAFVYYTRQPIGFVYLRGCIGHLRTCEKYIYNYRKTLFKIDSFEYKDVSNSELKLLLNRIIDIKADMVFRVNNILHTLFYIKDNDLFALRYKMDNNHLIMDEYKYDDFVYNVMTESEFILLDWYHTDNFGL